MIGDSAVPDWVITTVSRVDAGADDRRCRPQRACWRHAGSSATALLGRSGVAVVAVWIDVIVCPQRRTTATQEQPERLFPHAKRPACRLLLPNSCRHRVAFENRTQNRIRPAIRHSIRVCQDDRTCCYAFAVRQEIAAILQIRCVAGRLGPVSPHREPPGHRACRARLPGCRVGVRPLRDDWGTTRARRGP